MIGHEAGLMMLARQCLFGTALSVGGAWDAWSKVRMMCCWMLLATTPFMFSLGFWRLGAMCVLGSGSATHLCPDISPSGLSATLLMLSWPLQPVLGLEKHGGCSDWPTCISTTMTMGMLLMSGSYFPFSSILHGMESGSVLESSSHGV